MPKTIIDIETLRNSPNSDHQDLLEIIKKDPIIIANILKIANSAMYGFSGKVKNIKMAISLL
jgi:HD-like signal output (HDOD) protein